MAARVVDSGAGLQLDKSTFGPEDVKSAVNQITHNSTYNEMATKVGHTLRSAGGVHRAVDVIESTMRLGSAHLSTIDLKMPWHKVVQLDVIAVFVAVGFFITVMLRVAWVVIQLSAQVGSSRRISNFLED